MCYFALAAFKIFSLFLVFKSLIVLCLGMNFFGFLLFGAHSPSWIFRFMPFVKFGNYSHYSFECLLSPIPFLLFFWDSYDTSINLLVVVPRIPEAAFLLLMGCCFFFHNKSFFSLLLVLGNFYCSIFKFIDFFFYPLHSSAEPTHRVFNLSY